MKTIDDERDIATDHRPRRRPRSIDLRTPQRRSWLESPQMVVVCPLLIAFCCCVFLGYFLCWLIGGR